MTYSFPPLQWFEQGTTSYQVLLITLWGINIGLVSSILGLWVLKPRTRIVWWMAVAFWLSTFLFGSLFVGPAFSSNILRDLWSFAPRTFWVIAFLALPATVAGITELRRTSEQSWGFRNLLVWGCAIPLSVILMGNWLRQLTPSVGPGAARRHQCKMHLKGIGLAMNNFRDWAGVFPDSQTKQIDHFTPSPPRSWRVEILPLLDQYLVFRDYDRSATWDSPKNLPLAIQGMPNYVCPTTPLAEQRDASGRWYSAYALLIGPHTAFPDGKGLAPKAFSDGLSNTALVVEACGQQIIWTEPKDIEITATNIGINLPGSKPNQSSGIWSSYHRDQAFTLFADGSVRALNTDTDPQVLRAITTSNGGEEVGEF
ncbi:MAG: DUF1559 domain-containing protein [Planctomycetota bacterium]